MNLGQYLAGGDPLVTLQSLNPIYVNFGVPQQVTGQMQVGRAVRVTAEELAGTDLAGRITAIDSIVNEATRNVQVQATSRDPMAGSILACSCRAKCSCSVQRAKC